MNILVIGGTIFLGLHVLENAVTRGNTVTAFFRGRHAERLRSDVEYLRGDRTSDVDALRGRIFDAVIDTCGYHPNDQRLLAEVLAPSNPHYVFISTISVYASFPAGRTFDESAPRAEGDDGYGPAKARSEDAVLATYPRSTILRPGLIVGPDDPTGRFTHWPVRIAEGGPVLAPGTGSAPVQFIDVRDVAAFAVRCAEGGIQGTFNVTGPATPMTMRTMLDEIRTVTGSDADLVWTPEEVLRAENVAPWKDLPLWIPEDDPDSGGMNMADCTAAYAAGCTLRPLSATVPDLLSWYRDAAPPAPHQLYAPIDRERENAIIARMRGQA